MLSSPFAGIAKSCTQQTGWARITEIWKIKAHTSAHSGDTEGEVRGRVGNHEADLGAKRGARRHPQPLAGFWEGLRESEAALALLWRVAGATLPHYPVEKLGCPDKQVIRKPRLSWETRRVHCWQLRAG